jgi:hypothetical protein
LSFDLYPGSRYVEVTGSLASLGRLLRLGLQPFVGVIASPFDGLATGMEEDPTLSFRNDHHVGVVLSHEPSARATPTDELALAHDGRPRAARMLSPADLRVGWRCDRPLDVSLIGIFLALSLVRPRIHWLALLRLRAAARATLVRRLIRVFLHHALLRPPERRSRSGYPAADSATRPKKRSEPRQSHRSAVSGLSAVGTFLLVGKRVLEGVHPTAHPPNNLIDPLCHLILALRHEPSLEAIEMLDLGPYVSSQFLGSNTNPRVGFRGGPLAHSC